MTIVFAVCYCFFFLDDKSYCFRFAVSSTRVFAFSFLDGMSFCARPGCPRKRCSGQLVMTRPSRVRHGKSRPPVRVPCWLARNDAPAIRGTGFMECPEWASPYCDVRRFDDRCPTSNLAFYQCCEWLRASPLFARNAAAEVGEALAYVLVIECLVECIRER